MTFGRLYRSPRTREAALDEIDRCSGVQFDPQVVRAFFSAVGAQAA
jgi:response regulator RpfG family c-di-GMP phosphodiesterase